MNQDPSIIEVSGDGERIDYGDLPNADVSYSSNLGDEYRKSLNLNDYQVGVLNKLWYPSNNFSSIPFCRAEIVKMFVLILDHLAYRFQRQHTTIELEFNIIADLITFKHLSHGMNEYSYKYQMLASLTDIHNNIFKHAENALRTHYGHTRKINIEVDYGDTHINEEYDQRITSKILQILPIWIPKVEEPDEATERILYAKNSARWKIRFEELCNRYNKDADTFFGAVIKLTELNTDNPSLELIYFEASKFISSSSQEIALRLYISIISMRMYSQLHSTIDNTIKPCKKVSSRQRNSCRTSK